MASRNIWQRSLSSILVLSFLATLAGCTPAERDPVKVDFDARDQTLWDRTVKEFLLDDLWEDRDAYDAAHVLMAPLDAAFRSSDLTWQTDFVDHFDRFVDEASEVDSKVTTQKLWRLQYFYFASRFMSQASATESGRLAVKELSTTILGEITDVWLNREAAQWEAQFDSMRDRVEWKLTNFDVERSYYRAILDEELFTMAIAAEYRAYERRSLVEESWSPVVSDILETTLTMIDQESTRTDDGWLFQVGVWEDHRDFSHSGIVVPTDGMSPKVRPDVAGDSSHASRWPLWLRSFRDAYQPESSQYETYNEYLTRLANQFITHILVPPSRGFPYMRMHNYTDGWNGLYRWGYETAGDDNGYRPFELSGSLVAIWWGMLQDPRVADAYCELSQSFPLPPEAVALYVGPNTTRDRHPLVTWPGYFTNGFAELNVRLMCKLGR